MSEFDNTWAPYGVPFGRRGRARGGPGGMGWGMGHGMEGGPFGRRSMHGRGGPGRGRGGPGPRRRAPRGNVRVAILALLAEQSAKGGEGLHGYQMIQELSARTNGAWQPSPGSIYPTLQLLEDEGFVTSAAPEGKRVYRITAAGQEEFERLRGAQAPWDEVWDRFGSAVQLKVALRETVHELVSTVREATDENRDEILSALSELRRKLAAFRGDIGGDDAEAGGFGPDEPDEFRV